MSRKNIVLSNDFSVRLLHLMEAVGFGDRQRVKFANKIGISPNFLSDVINLKSGPSFNLLFGVANNWPSVNLTWLLTGEGAVFKEKNLEEANLSVDMDLLGRIIDRLEHWLENGRKQLPSKKKARLISLLYEKFAETGKDVDDDTVVSYLKLVA